MNGDDDEDFYGVRTAGPQGGQIGAIYSEGLYSILCRTVNDYGNLHEEGINGRLAGRGM